MPPLRLIACTLAALVLLASDVQAARHAVSTTRNGTYYTFDDTQAAVVAAKVRNGRVPTLEVMPPISSGPGVGFIYTSAGRFSHKATWSIGPVCGKAVSIGRLGISFDCNARGPNNRLTAASPLVATRAPVPTPTPNPYTGTVTPTTVGGGAATGTTGTLTLTVSGDGTVTGSGTFAPVDPMTGIASGPPSVNVSYGPISAGTNDSAVKGSNPLFLAGGCGPTFFTRLGMFCLPSDPPGFTLIGGFVPVPIYSGGLVRGSIYTAAAMGSPPSYGPALPATFRLFGPPSGGL